MKQEITGNVTEIAERVAESLGLEIVEVQLLGSGSQRLLRIYIDRETGVSHEDCEKVSRQIGELLDAEDVIPGPPYTLEVSSPGIERKLSKPKEFQRFTGHRIVVYLREPVESAKRWEGLLESFEDNRLSLTIPSGKKIAVDLSQIEKANLKFEWK
jgi:ribosome maturation factor RimP